MVARAPFIEIDGTQVKQLASRINLLNGRLRDLRPLWEQFSADFYKNEKSWFSGKGPGKFIDLTKKYKIAKQKKWGFVYPILVASGRLSLSLLSRNSREAINVVAPKVFVIGTAVPYGIYHHDFNARKRRPLWAEEADGRMFERWNRLADNYLRLAAEGKL